MLKEESHFLKILFGTASSVYIYEHKITIPDFTGHCTVPDYTEVVRHITNSLRLDCVDIIFYNLVYYLFKYIGFSGRQVLRKKEELNREISTKID